MTVSTRAKVLAALDRIDPHLGAFITVDPDTTVRRASAEPGGRLSGVTVAVKDLIDTAGLRTTYGSPRYRYHTPTTTAPFVARLERDGAIVLGKTNLNEFAYGVSGYNPHYGMMRTPADPDRTPGGSSGGSAVAVAAGVCDLGVGTDTSGSVRIPAACCGIFGFKCANGAVSMSGVHPLSPRNDSIGYFARDVALIQRVLGISALPPVTDLRVEEFDDLEPTGMPLDAHWVLFRHEAYTIHKAQAAKTPEEYGDDLHTKMSRPVGDVPAAEKVLNRWRDEFDRRLRDVDLVVMPVFPGEAPTVAEVMRDYRDGTLTTSERLLSITPIANALGWPAFAVPTPEGPRQILGRPGTEPSILALGARLSARA
ncbi:amidase [Actinomadura viridis]|uniref:Asp-tRNA(Asn)/Glu-tRNA(Gln) amidotransferase A subunit family amidase n=1 Tax=Actinomadura viridis TaxID=58110 RepID=A0A931DIC2_9ACTN|nr:amidase [Actinomadura viridis]MBG6089274.1 Asp-tRNA(Asn)/Glu-tRNA(Gln) amidotransferase A subunit family amidase [Actinomadura viridis]